MDNLRGILLMVAAMAGFALEDTAIKMLSESLPVGQILIWLGFGGGLIFAVLARIRGQKLLDPALWTPLLIVRHLGELLGTLAMVSALSRIPLTTVAGILQAMPLTVTLGAALFLGAPVGWLRWLAILIGLSGVLLMIRPGMDTFEPASLFALGAVVFLSIRDLATRAAPAQVSSLVMSCYGFVAAGIAGIVLMAFGPPAAPLNPTLFAWLAFGITVGVSGYYAIVAAMRVGDVATVTPFRYTRLIFAMILGILVFGERPDAPTLIGAAIVIASGLYTLWREKAARSSALSIET